MQCHGTCEHGNPCPYEAVFIVFTGCCNVAYSVCPGHAQQTTRVIQTALLTDESLPCLVTADWHRSHGITGPVKEHGIFPAAMAVLGMN